MSLESSGWINLRCFGGCVEAAIHAALGVEKRELGPPLPEQKAKASGRRLPQRKTPLREHVYRDESGQELFKKIRWPDGSGSKCSLEPEGQPPCLYNRDGLAAARERGITGVLVCEGERDVDSALKAGAVATTWREAVSPSGGFGPVVEALEKFGFSKFSVVYDRDEAGEKAGKQLVEELRRRGHEAYRLLPKPLHENADLTDHLDAGFGLEELTDAEGPLLDYAALLREFEQHLVIADRDLLAVILATVLAVEIPGDPVWMLVVQKSSGGKTTFIEPLRDQPSCYFLSSLTPASFVSGKRATGKKQQDFSLLPKLDRKCLVVKDLTALLTLKSDAKAEVFSILRDAYDGSFEKAFGNESETVRVKSRFGFVAAVTGAIDREVKLLSELGTRFLMVRPKGASDDDVLNAVIARHDSGVLDFRDQLADAVDRFLRSVARDPVEMTSDRTSIDKLHRYVRVGAVCRTAVSRSYWADRKDGVLEYAPEVEGTARFMNVLLKLGRALCWVLNLQRPNERVWKILRRVAVEAAPPFRMAVLRALDVMPNGSTQVKIARSAMIDLPTARAAIRDFADLGLVRIAGRMALVTL